MNGVRTRLSDGGFFNQNVYDSGKLSVMLRLKNGVVNFFKVLGKKHCMAVSLTR